MKIKLLFLVVLIVFFMGCPDIFPNGGGNGGGTNDVALGAPSNLNATPKTNAIDLSWDQITNENLKGFNIYRTLNQGKDYGKINSYPITDSSFRDDGLTGGITYYYVVTSITKTDKESNYSEEANAVPIILEDKNQQSPYMELCGKEPTQLKIDQCLNEYALGFNDISACREMKELNVDKCIKEIAVKLNDYDSCKEIKLKNVTIRDECFYEISIALKDATGCNQIITTTKANECNAIVAAAENSLEACRKISVIKDKDICFKALALTGKNYVICNYISTAKTDKGFERDDCLNTILSTVKEETLCEYFIDQKEKNNCYWEVGAFLKNHLICKKSSDQNITDHCIKDVAIAEEDSDYCLQIEDTNIFQECVIAVSEANPNKDVCALITELSVKDTCYYNTAKATEKDVYCTYIIENEIKDTCYSELAIELNNAALCGKIRYLSPNLRNYCYSTVAVNSLNSILCEKVTGSDTYVSCYKAIAIELTDYTICDSASKRFTTLVYLTQDYCFYGYAEETKEANACEQINNPVYRNDCDVNALAP
ncbi:fibronectin type III domain-containing protein [Candidatus Micrarchaeota archaeon]|nr:fibronectin type III domain-containing protein [Candidatus Micrarchaeota archaeon]